MTKAHSPRPPGESARTGRAAAAIAVSCWAAGNVMVRAVPMPGIQIAFWRILLGAVVYHAILRFRGRSLTFDQLRTTAPTAVAISLEIAVFFVAIKATTVANATVIGALAPLVVLAVASRESAERVTTWLIGMAFVATAGVVLVIVGSSSELTWSPRGDALAVVATALFAAYFLFAKRARSTVDALELQTAIWIIGSFVVAPLALIDAGGVDPPSPSEWAWLVALLIVPGSGHMLMNWAHGRVRVSYTSLLTLAIPVLSTVGAAIAFDETIDALQVIGMAIVCTVLVAVVRRDAQLDTD